MKSENNLFNSDLKFDPEKLLLNNPKPDTYFQSLKSKSFSYFESHSHYKYTPSDLLSYWIQSYSVIVLFKAVNRMWKYYHISYPELCNSSLFNYGAMNLATVDPTYILAIIISCLNYMVIRSPHDPIAVNLMYKFSPLAKMLQCAVVGSLWIALPKAYLLTYIGYASTHLVIRYLSYWLYSK